MNSLKYLEFKRLMKELQFVELDYLYQSEIIKIGDNDFLKSVDDILDRFPNLREIYIKKQINFIESVNVETTVAPVLEHREESPPQTRKIYRDIVKSTHPDKIKNNKLNELYLEATGAYESNDIVTLYKVCSELNIDFEIPEDFIDRVRTKINSYKDRVSFLEGTYTFKWLKTETQNERDQIVISFIRNKIL